MLLLWVVISAALVAVALVLNTSGHKACIQSMGTACPSRPVPQHADASAHDRQHLPARERRPELAARWLPVVSAAQSHP